MAVTEQPKTFSDLYTLLMNTIRADTSQSATVSQAKRAINMGLVDMHIGMSEKFHWAERTTVLRTQQQYTTGTVDISQGSQTLTGTSSAWNTNNAFSVKNARAGGKMVINGTQEIYEVSTVTSDTLITLATPYIGDTVDDGTYLYFEDEYALASDFLRPLDMQNFDIYGNIPIVGRREFRQRYPRNTITGKPKVATLFDKAFSGSATPVRKIAFWQPPDDFYQIPYSYITSNLAVSTLGVAQVQLSADADEPIVPLNYRTLIFYWASYLWYRDKKDDTRSQEAREEYNVLLARIAGDVEIGQSRPQIRPRMGIYKNAARRPYSSSASKYTSGTAFDQMRDK